MFVALCLVFLREWEAAQNLCTGDGKNTGFVPTCTISTSLVWAVVYNGSEVRTASKEPHIISAQINSEVKALLHESGQEIVTVFKAHLVGRPLRTEMWHCLLASGPFEHWKARFEGGKFRMWSALHLSHRVDLLTGREDYSPAPLSFTAALGIVTAILNMTEELLAGWTHPNSTLTGHDLPETLHNFNSGLALA